MKDFGPPLLRKLLIPEDRGRGDTPRKPRSRKLRLGVCRPDADRSVRATGADPPFARVKSGTPRECRGQRFTYPGQKTPSLVDLRMGSFDIQVEAQESRRTGGRYEDTDYSGRDAAIGCRSAAGWVGTFSPLWARSWRGRQGEPSPRPELWSQPRFGVVDYAGGFDEHRAARACAPSLCCGRCWSWWPARSCCTIRQPSRRADARSCACFAIEGNASELHRSFAALGWRLASLRMTTGEE